MTNGEKIKEVFPSIGLYEKSHDAIQINFDSVWWNAEYKEPTTKNDLPHCQYSDEEIAKSFIEDVGAVKDQLPCGEQMDFPNTFDEFAKNYGFKDKNEVYTNGIELIPVYRVKQWLEHISTTKNDLGVEYISRSELMAILSDYYDTTVEYRSMLKEIAALPPVTPQEPKTGHWIFVGEENEEETRNGNFRYICSECGYSDVHAKSTEVPYCWHCGAKMVDPQESEDKE